MFPEGTNTYAGIIVAVLPAILGIFGVHVVQSDQFDQLILDGVTLLGSIYAFYGRARATTPGMLAKTAPVVPAAQ